MFLKKISISARLILVMSLIALLTSALAAYLILRFIDSGKQVEVLAEEGTQGIIWGEKANFYLHNLIINFYRASSGDMKWVKAMEDHIPNISFALNEYAKTAHDPENKRLLAETREALEVYARDIRILAQSFRQGIYGPDIIKILNKLETKPHANRLITAIKNLVEYSKAMAEDKRSSFFADMAANTRASIFLACVVLIILVFSGYMGVIWTRDEIAEYNAKERLLKKLQTDLLNSLEAAGAVSSLLTFDNGLFTFVGEVEKILGQSPDTISNLIEYVQQIHQDDRKNVLSDVVWEKFAHWNTFLQVYQDEFIEVDGRKILKADSLFVQNWVDQAGSATATNQREFRCPSRPGEKREWRWKRSLSKLLPHPSGRGYIGESGILFDITEEYEIRDELIRAKYDAEAASRAKSDFLARMSHEIRTPMNAIIGMSHLVLRTQLSDPQKDYQSKILSAAQQLMTIINDILDFSKIEAGKMGIENIAFQLDDVFKSLADVILLKAQEKQLEVIFSLSDDTPQCLVGDSLRLTQVLINLTNNAVKFTPSGEIRINVGVMEQTDHEVQLHFTVTDSGIGLTDEQINELFQPFTQADGSITRKFGGTGLGLAISKSLVEAMGGSIWVESQPDKGCSFHFTVRLALAPDQPEKYFLPHDLRHLKILVIDDNETALNCVVDMLETIFSVVPERALSADAALEKIKLQHGTSSPYNLIFIDWHMPYKDGIQTTLLIKDCIGKTVSQPFFVLMISTYDVEKIRTQAQRAGVDDFLVKPTCPSNIFDIVANLYGEKSDSCRGTSAEVSQEKLDQVRGTRILLVEDNVFNQQIAEEFLIQAGMVVEIASNGVTALQCIEKNAYDLIFMDIQMPDLDGLEVTRRIRDSHDLEELPIVAMTAHAMSGDREKSMEAGMNDHITKPIHPEELMAMLVKWGNPCRGVAFEEPSPPQPSIRQEKGNDPEIPYLFAEIDAQEGLKRCMGIPASYLRFLKLFYREYCGLGEQTTQYVRAGEYEKLWHLVHAVKGPAGSIGATKFQAVANDLENRLRNGEKSFDDELLRVFQKSFDAVIHDLESIIPDKETTVTDSTSDTFDVDVCKVQELLGKLRGCLEKSDAEAVIMLSELNSAQARSELGRDWTLLQSQITNFDFEEALGTLTRIESNLHE